MRQSSVSIVQCIRQCIAQKVEQETIAAAISTVILIIIAVLVMYLAIKEVTVIGVSAFIYSLSLALQFTGALVAALDSFDPLHNQLKSNCVSTWGEVSGCCLSVPKARAIIASAVAKRVGLFYILVGFLLALIAGSPEINAASAMHARIRVYGLVIVAFC